jgi:hypothetical protein
MRPMASIYTGRVLTCGIYQRPISFGETLSKVRMYRYTQDTVRSKISHVPFLVFLLRSGGTGLPVCTFDTLV